MPFLCLAATLALGFPPDDPAGDPQAVIGALERATTDAIAKAERSVVAIARYKNPENPEVTTAIKGTAKPPREQPRPGVLVLEEDDLQGEMSYDFGSGVVVGPSEILTAFHVVQGAERLMVRAPGLQEFEAEVIAADSYIDLAVISPRAIPDKEAPALTPIAIGDSAALRRGSFLFALGNPFDAAKDGQPSASWGILSNTYRKMIPPPLSATGIEQLQMPLRHRPSLLQLDAKLNLGMSGGAVINLRGELVGITTAAANPSSFDAQAGYAIPMDALGRRAVESLKKGQEVEYGFLGIGLDKQGTNRIENVQAGTPASLAGLLNGDAILAVNERPVRTSEELVIAINEAEVGRPVELTVERGGKTIKRPVMLSKLKVMGTVIATNRPTPWRGLRVDYVSAVFSPFDRSVLDYMSTGGVGIAAVEPNSPADKAGLRAGMIILEAAGTKVTKPTEFLECVKDLKGEIPLKTDQGIIRVP